MEKIDEKIKKRGKKEEINLTDNLFFVVKLDNDWTADELSILFDSFNKLYLLLTPMIRMSQYDFEKIKGSEKNRIDSLKFYLNQVIAKILGEMKSTSAIHLFSTNKVIEREDNLRVYKMKMSSQGSIDFLGIGKIMETMKEILFYYLPNKKTYAEIKKIELENESLMIKNLKDCGFDDTQIKKIIFIKSNSTYQIKKLMQSKKIIRIQTMTPQDYNRE